MATTLYAITNASLTGKETKKDWRAVVKKLQSFKIETTSYTGVNNEIIKEKGDWEYEIEKETSFPFQVDFLGPFHVTPTLYSNLGVIHTIYGYSLLYKNYELDWFYSFRQDLFQIVTAIGGTEVIYLADNTCDKLGSYLECMALGNIPYKDIKQQMIKELGEPVTNYAQLNYDKLSYKNISEFFLDDFNDLR